MHQEDNELWFFQGIWARAEACVWRNGGHVEGRY